MNVLVLLMPAALILGGLALLGFFWALRHNQFDDPRGHATRILSDRYDDHPADEEPRAKESSDQQQSRG